MKKLKKKIIVKILRELHFQPSCHNLNEYYSNIMHNPILDRHGMFVMESTCIYDGDFYIGYKNGKKSRMFTVLTSAYLKKQFPYVSKEGILPDINF